MPTAAVPDLPEELAPATGLLQTLLAIAPIGIVLLRLLYAEDDAASPVDFAFGQLNPAARQMLGGLPERPAGSLRTLFPSEQEVGGFAFYRRAFLSGQAERYQQLYQADGYDGYYQVVAQRHENQLVVTFTDTNEQPRSVVELALRESQARERAARAEAELQRQRFYDALQQLPAQVAIHTGPDHVYSFVNQRFTAYVPAADALGRPVRELATGAMSEDVLALFDQVYQTGAVAQAHEVAVQLPASHPEASPVFVDTCYQPLRDVDGHIYGVLDFSYDVTEQVLARQQVEHLNQELAARTQEARQAQAAAERGQAQLQALLTQAPVAIALFQGEEVRVATVNERMAALWGRTPAQVLGQPLVEAVPELRGQGFEEIIRQVQLTGVPYVGAEAPATILQDGKLVVRYYDYSCQPIYDAQGELLGVLNVGAEVTEQVAARRTLERLNQELETRVRERTRELANQQALLGQILSQVPAAIATLAGPEHRFSFFNAPYQALVAGRAELGRPVAEVLGEVEEQGFIALLDQVYRTGQPFAGTDTVLMLHDPATGQAEQRYVDFVYQPLFEGQQRPQGILAFVVDVTEKVRASKQADTLQAAMLAVVQRQRAERENVYQLFGQAPAAICLLREPNHRIEYLNPAYQALYPGQALQGHTLAEVQPDNPALVTLFDGVYQGGQSQFQPEVPIQIAQPDGLASPTRYFDFTYQAYREDGRIAGVSIFGFDVTERVLSRRQVEDTARQLRLLTDALPVLIGYLDGERRYQFTNRAYEAWFHQPADALLGRPVRDVVGEAAYQATAGYMDRALAGERVEFTARMPYRAGFVKHIHTDYIPDVQQGEVVGFYTLVADVTEQVTIREQLEAQQAELQRLFELAPVAISVYRGDEYVIEFVNPPLAAIVGQVPPQMLGRQLVEFMPDMRRQGLQAVLDNVRRTGEPFVAQELPITVVRNEQQELGYFNFVYQPLPDAHGQRTGVVCVATEVTEQVRARQQVQVLNEHLATVNEQVQATNAELHNANQRLTRTNADLDTFVYTASHDLKAPITNIEGLLEALQADLPAMALQDPLVHRLLSLMQDSVARFQQTLGHLTDVSRLQQPEETASVNLPELIDAVCLDLAPLLEAAAAQLTVEVQECVAVHVAPKTLRSVVYNLLSNAVKYRAPERPAQVQLRAHCTPGQLVLAVQDNGLGLTEAQQTEVFGMFRRLHTHVEGSGVGLFMVKRLVENAGGTITVQSQLAVGTTFTVLLPA